MRTAVADDWGRPGPVQPGESVTNGNPLGDPSGKCHGMKDRPDSVDVDQTGSGMAHRESMISSERPFATRPFD